MKPHFVALRAVAALLVLAAVDTRGDEPATPTLGDIISNVRANEQLYENIDIVQTYSYEFGNQASIPNFDGGGPKIPSTQEAEIHFVSQNGMFRTDRKGKISFSGDVHTMDRIRAFDGTMTRLYEQNAYANLNKNRLEDETYVRPHMFLLRFMNFLVPLSTYLSGDEAIRAYPGSHWNSGYRLDVTYLGPAEHQGLRCHRVWATTVIRGAPWDRWELWLAEDRNFIPVRNIAYTFKTSKTDAVGDMEVTDWSEIEPGIWFPKSSRCTAYDQRKMMAGQLHEPQWVETLSTEQVSLDPQFEVEYFRDVPMPDGTTVYEVEQGKVTSGHVQGAPAVTERPTVERVASRWWLLWVNLAVLIMIGGLIAGRRYLLRQRT